MELRKSRDGVSGTEPIRAVAERESREGRMQQGWRRGNRGGDNPLCSSLLYFPCVLLISSVQTTFLCARLQIFALPIFARSIIQTDTIFTEEQSF